jgi:hypothetical protein
MIIKLRIDKDELGIVVERGVGVVAVGDGGRIGLFSFVEWMEELQILTKQPTPHPHMQSLQPRIQMPRPTHPKGPIRPKGCGNKTKNFVKLFVFGPTTNNGRGFRGRRNQREQICDRNQRNQT